MKDDVIRILLVEDEDDSSAVSGLLDELPGNYSIRKVQSRDKAAEELARGYFDLVLLDYLRESGITTGLLDEMQRLRRKAPAILFTKNGTGLADTKAIDAGVVECLDKAELSAPLLERIIRYSVESRKTEFLLRRVNRALTVLKECNRAITHAHEESSLFKEICRIAVETGGYRFCWVGLVNETSPFVSPIAYWGSEQGYLKVREKWQSDDFGRGPTGSSIRTGKTYVTRAIGSDTLFEPWRAEAIGRGYASCIAVPLKEREQVFGTICIYSAEQNGFDHEEVRLLEELAEELSFGIASLRDRAERLKAERALQEKANFLNTLIDALPNPIFYKNSSGLYEGCNKAFEAITGLKSYELIGKTVHDIAPPGSAGRYSNVDSVLLEQGGVMTYESPYKTSDNNMHELVFTKAAYRNQDGKVGGIVGIVLDMTDRKNAESTIRERERYFRSILASMHEDIFVINPDYRISDVNKAFLDTIQRKREDVVGRFCYEVLQQKHRPCGLDGRKCAHEKIFRAGAPVTYRTEMARPDGARVELSGICSPLIDETGKVTRMIIALRDTSNEARLESELRQAQKMEAIGTLAGGVAHDFNNILGIILGYTELTSLQLPSDSREFTNLSHVQKACMRGKELVRQILAFSRKSRQEKYPLHLGAVLKEALKLLRSALPSSIEIEHENHLPYGKDLIIADATHMHQVIMNLCANAAYAMAEKGGILRVTLSAISITINDLPEFPDLLPGEYIRMSFRDTGHGIAPELIDRIFEPYFTTRGPGQGTGLGLAVVHGIVKDHKGAVQVYSDPGNETIFHVYLPRIIREAPEQKNG